MSKRVIASLQIVGLVACGMVPIVPMRYISITHERSQRIPNAVAKRVVGHSDS